MTSNHPWPLLWHCGPIILLPYEVVRALRTCLKSAWTHTYMTEWERQRHSVVPTCVMAWLGHWHGWSLSSSLHGRKLILFPQRDIGCWHWTEVTWSRDDTWNLFATTKTRHILQLGKLLRRGWWNLMSWTWCLVQHRYKYVILAPLHYIKPITIIQTRITITIACNWNSRKTIIITTIIWINCN